jgi:hypothetical protein
MDNPEKLDEEKTKQIYTTTSIRKHSEARFAYGGYGC